ncbi:15833_t:CDS:2, partial [Funneliformis geosporum]
SGEPQLGWAKKYGNFVKFHGILNQPSILLTDTKIIQEITLNQVYDYSKQKMLIGDGKAIFGEGLALAEGESHKRQRKMMNPAFTHNHIKNMIPTFIHVASKLTDLIEGEVNEGETKIVLTPYLTKATLDIIGLVGFSHEFNSLTSPSELAEAYESLFSVSPSISSICLSIVAGYIPFIRKVPIEINKRFNKSTEVIDRESKKLMKEKYNDDKNNKLDGNDLLSLLIKLNKTLPNEEKVTDNELKSQIMTFLLAGHITTSISTSWALYQLAHHPHEQDLLREELVRAFPEKSKFNPTFDEINSLEYLNCVVKEALRLTPPAPDIQRVNNKDVVLDGHFIPKNTTLMIPIAALQRLPSIWGSTAENFDPNRWLDPSLIKKVNNYYYLPFHTGIRSCIGNKLALNEFKILLSMLVRNFVFRPVEGIQIDRDRIGKVDQHVELMVSKVET